MDRDTYFQTNPYYRYSLALWFVDRLPIPSCLGAANKEHCHGWEQEIVPQLRRNHRLSTEFLELTPHQTPFLMGKSTISMENHDPQVMLWIFLTTSSCCLVDNLTDTFRKRSFQMFPCQRMAFWHFGLPRVSDKFPRRCPRTCELSLSQWSLAQLAPAWVQLSISPSP